mgnify:CR=1 FL=1
MDIQPFFDEVHGIKDENITSNTDHPTFTSCHIPDTCKMSINIEKSRRIFIYNPKTWEQVDIIHVDFQGTRPEIIKIKYQGKGDGEKGTDVFGDS